MAIVRDAWAANVHQEQRPPQQPPPPDVPPAPPADGGTSDSAPQNIGDPVPGVSDIDAYNLAVGGLTQEDGTPLSYPWDPEEVRNLVQTWSDQPVSDERVNAIVTQMPQVLARGRTVMQANPGLDEGQPGDQSNYTTFANPDDLAQVLALPPDQRRPKPKPDYYQSNPNPPFAAVRGGPTAAPEAGGIGQERLGPALADYLEGAGVNPNLAGLYRTVPVAFNIAPDAPPVGLAYQSPDRIELARRFLTAQEPVTALLQAAQHEAAHVWGAQRQPAPLTDATAYTPVGYSEAYRQALTEDPGLAWLAHRGQAYEPVPLPPGSAHDYTAPFDLGMTLAELPPILQPFYMDSQGNPLLPVSPWVELLRQRGLEQGPSLPGR